MVLGLLIAVVIALFVAVSIISVIIIYNRFQQLKNGAEATLNQIKVALKKRLKK